VKRQVRVPDGEPNGYDAARIITVVSLRRACVSRACCVGGSTSGAFASSPDPATM
jgi:hypothetical protein